MNFTKFSEFNESLQNPKVVWLPEALPFWQTNTLPVVIIPSGFPKITPDYILLYIYLLPVTTLNRYKPSISNKKKFFPLHLGMYLLADMEYLW